MTVSTNTTEQCPQCQILRAPLNEGGWCETCGWNPEYERLLQDLRSALAAQVLHCPKIQYDGIYPDEDGVSWIWLKIGPEEWVRWVHPGAPAA